MSGTPVAGAPTRASIAAGGGALGLQLDAGQLDRLEQYLQLMARWNRVYNLTAVRDPADMLTHHLLDSLAVVRPLGRRWADMSADLPPPAPARRGPRVMDVGSGAGLPGVVIAICWPEADVTCVDAVRKKSAFVQQVAVELKLPNLRGLHGRVETLLPPAHAYDIVCCRAFASLKDFTTWSAAALAPQGCWLAMKGKAPADEVAELDPSIDVFHVEQLAVPHLDAERRLVWMRKRGDPS